MMNKIKKIFGSEITLNAIWIIAGKVIHMAMALIVGLLSARMLGPSNYGLINYATAYTNMFASICTLGINSVIVKFFVDSPEDSGKTVGTALVLRTVSSVLSVLMICSVSFFMDREDPLTVSVVALCSLGLIFQVCDTFNYWFQYRLESKFSAIAQTVAYLIMSAYKLFLLFTSKDVRWFAISTSVDYVCLAVCLFCLYKKRGGQKLSFSKSVAFSLLNKSKHYILSGLMVSIYGFTDKFMLKHMLSESAVGYYSTAVQVSSIWVFVLTAIIDSFFPEIMKLHGKDKNAFERKNRQLYNIVFYISVVASAFITIFSDLIVNMLYGFEYAPAAEPLRIVTWYVAFSYLGVARNAWIVCEDKQRYLTYIYICAAFTNVLLNIALIPMLGTVGASIASLVTQTATVIAFPLLVKGLRKNVKLVIDAILFQKLR